MQTEIALSFADGEYLFRLPIKRICEIEEKAGPIDAVKHRLMAGGWGIHDIVETIRQGLIGGGKGEVNGVETSVTPLRANSLIDRYVDGHAIGEHLITAQAIIAALYVGYEPTDGKKKAQAETENLSESTGEQPSTTASPSD